MYQQGICALGNLKMLGSGVVGKGKWGRGIWGLDECIGGWLARRSVLGFVFADVLALNWDAGFVERWVEELAEWGRMEGENVMEDKESNSMEKGERKQGVVLLESGYWDDKVKVAYKDEEVEDEMTV